MHTFCRLIQIEHTLFGLPFALMGTFLALTEGPRPTWSFWFWVVLAFSGARTAGMSFNRLVDRHIDALNPRTCKRALPAKEITPRQVALVAWIALFLFIFACSRLNPLCFFLSIFVAFLLAIYSYSKRYTPLCHFLLGLIEFFAPFLGWVAVTGSFAWPPVFLGLAVFFWIGGMDVIYAMQDVGFDRQYHLHSLCVTLGEEQARQWASGMHVIAYLLLWGVGIGMGLSWIYYVGLLICGFLFLHEHRLIQKGDIQRAFFTCNSLIALTQCLGSVCAIWW